MTMEGSVPGVWTCAVVAIVMAASATTYALDVPRYTGGVLGNASVAHDGGLRWTVGVNACQVVRSCPSDPSRSDGTAFTIRHHPFIAYWGGRFWVYPLGSTQNEADKGGRVQWSADGVTWNMSDSCEAFGEVTHQRCAFYVAANGRYLVTAWYGGGETARGEEGSRRRAAASPWSATVPASATSAGRWRSRHPPTGGRFRRRTSPSLATSGHSAIPTRRSTTRTRACSTSGASPKETARRPVRRCG
jgi:hypothetical protein